MIDDEKINNIRRALTRIFCLPINRSTYREIHNAFFNILGGNVENANHLMETLLNANPNTDKAKIFPKEKLKSLIEDFSIPLLTSKDVFEKGDFINIITSDLINSPQQPVFAHRLKRIDGEEFHFITDIDSTMHLVKHFTMRIQELKKNPDFKNLLIKHKGELEKFKEDLEHILSSKN